MPSKTLILIFQTICCIGAGNIAAQESKSKEYGADEDICVDAIYVSQTNASCGMTNGSVTFTVDTFIGAPCCPNLSSISIKVVLRNASNNRVDSITISSSGLDSLITFGGMAQGTYNLLVTGSNGATLCASTIKPNFVTIISSAQTVVSIPPLSIVNETCVGSKNGSFTVSASDGDSPYSFQVNSLPPQSQSGIGEGTPIVFSSLGAGTYTVIVTDNSSCIATASVTIVANAPGITVTIPPPTSPSCFNGSNGQASVSASGGGSTSFTYNWSNGDPDSLAQNLAAGTYTVVITGNGGCSKTETVVVGNPSMLQVTVSKTNVTCNGLADGTATVVSSSGGTAPRTIKWSNDSTSATITKLVPGTYTVTITDSKGCTTTSSVSVTQPNTLNFTADLVQNPIQSGQQAQIILSGTVDIQSFSWKITSLINLNPTSMTGAVTNGLGTVSIVKNFTTVSDRSPGAAAFQIVSVFSSNCTGDTQYVNVTVLPDVGTTADPFIPEIYTPNGDGQNDEWLVVMPDGVQKGEYTIFNRVGGKVYEGDTMTPWDGTGCPDGAYFYVLRYTQNGAEKVKKGAITILRTSR